MDFSVLLSKMLIFTVLMLLGYVFARRGLVDRAFARSTSMLVMSVFLPATILNSVFVAEALPDAAALLKLLGLVTLTMLVGYLFAALAVHLLPVGRDGQRAAVFELLIGLCNNMFIAMPVAQSLFGPQAVFYCALSCIPFNLYAYTYGVWRLRGGGKGGLRVRDMLSVPLLATVVAVLVFFFRLPVPGLVKELAAALNGATVPMSLLVIGFSMGAVSLGDAFRNRALYLVSLLRLLVVPLLVWLLVSRFTADAVLLTTCLLIAASPSAVMVSVFAIQYGRDSLFAAEGVLQSTVLSLVTIPLLLLILGG